MLELEALETVTTSGLVLPGNAEATKLRRAVVRGVGRDVQEVKVGDRVLLSGYAGTTVEGDELARLVREPEILGVLHAGE